MKQIFRIKISALLLGSALSLSVGAVAALLPLLFLVPLYKKLGNAGIAIAGNVIEHIVPLECHCTDADVRWNGTHLLYDYAARKTHPTNEGRD